MFFFGYLFIKFLFYSGWCYLGLRILNHQSTAPFKYAQKLGFLRTLIGFITGAIIAFIIPSIARILNNDYATYFAVYPLIRFIEWMAIAYWVERSKNIWRLTVAGWACGGIIISFIVTDLPVFLLLGGPFTGKVGRLFC